MLIITHDSCLSYYSLGHPERPYRVAATTALLKERHPDWDWQEAELLEEEKLRCAHLLGHLERLSEPVDFDADTAYHDDIYSIARRSAGATMAAMDVALEGKKAFSLMRPPGHHAERDRAMGFCYLSNIAICALEALARGMKRVAVWDFDVHHGNGTEAILQGVEGVLYASVHQHPCYPGTGSVSSDNCLNYPMAPYTPVETLMHTLESSWQELLDFEPELVLVSAGFDAYENDPLAEMTLRKKDFQTLGSWLKQSGFPVAATLEGGYSDDLPELIDAFLSGWEG